MMRGMNNFFIYLIVSIVAFSGILFGFDTGVIAGVLEPIIAHFHLTTVQTEIMVSSVLLGALLGAYGSGKVSDIYGRRTILLSAAVCFIVGTLASALAMTISMLVIGRAILGLAIGMTSFTAPLYISEVAPKENRGSLVILNTVMVTLGIVIAYSVDFAFSQASAWRWMLGIGVIPAILMGLGLLFLPKSPRGLMEKGKTRLAHSILSRIRRTSSAAEQELSEIQQIISKEKSYKKYSTISLYRSHFRPILLVGIALATIQQVTGINVILYYSPMVMQMIGFKLLWAKMLGTMGLGITNFLMTVVALCLVDKVGRRILLLIGLSGMVICLMIVALGLSPHLPSVLHWICFYALILFVAFYALSIGCLFWLLISEIYPLKIRGQAMSVAATVNWTTNFIVALTFLSLTQFLGVQWTFGLYALVAFFSVIFCYYFVPETKRISLELIEQHLLAGKPLRKLGQ
jgi:sugar porter (SP) family MFS transporter